ncbi:hypothetical protein F1J25_03850 [Listeria monocytogenes]|uniref:Uncharacterized protein n=1 Tax=Listeria monocytogenes TaxID=1639 RepID=A0A3H3KU42_LISMN|nr:hypothetical protein CY94_06740 [Listeria monocytogenes]EAG6288738.1 hypothetical protein [Listeria monocytogenes CFSAN003825]EAG6315992.1 hypothetical protein [Listeria monocytogenes CFSAN003824]EDO1176481.1 hypothetical protein [Listeria innocua]MBS9361671.1 hypothetical protein [Listeria welshimeri]
MSRQRKELIILKRIEYVEIIKKIPGTPFRLGGIYEIERMGSANARVRINNSIYQVPKEALQVVEQVERERWEENDKIHD